MLHPMPAGSPQSSSPDDARCLQVDVDEADVDVVSGELWAGGATGVQELPLGSGRVRLVAGFPRRAEAGLVDRLAPRSIDCFDSAHDGWLDAWRPFARPVRVGRVVVHPPWEPPPWPDLPVTEGDVVVAIDPGRAFGAGNHATTRLMVAALLTEITPSSRVLDVGCGSGVLSVTAALIGAAEVVGVDVEEEAVRATHENAARNGVAARVDTSATPVGEVVGTFDLVAANILAPVLVELAPAIVARCRAGGRIVLSGLQVSQIEPTLAAYRAADPHLRVVDETTDGEWVRLTLAR
jgi:ribosomal protein L11 methyltransferase